MPKKLGKIEKPSVERFQATRKLYCVPLFPQLPNKPPKDYEEKVSLYWSQVSKQIGNLETAGKIARIYHESVSTAEEDKLKAVKQMNQNSYQLVKAKVKQGAELLALEDPEILGEYLDWSICLSVVGRNLNVVRKILEFQREATTKRDEYIINKIDETLKTGEAGTLLMTDETRIRIQPKFPSDIQVFLVHPPAFSDLQRWFQHYLDDLRGSKNRSQQD